MNFLVLLENHGNAEGYNFVPEKMFLGIKRDFLSSFARFPGGKYRTAMTRSLLNRKLLVANFKSIR